MNSKKLIAFAIAVVGMFLLFGCTEPSPVASTLTPEQALAGSQARAIPGSYELTFHDSNAQHVSSLPVGATMYVHAYVEDSSGLPAQSGEVRFEVCRLPGQPGTRAPKAECETGRGVWELVARVKVDDPDASRFCVSGPGNACYPIGAASSARTRGYRFLYSPQGSSIAKGASPALDFIWF